MFGQKINEKLAGGDDLAFDRWFGHLGDVISNSRSYNTVEPIQAAIASDSDDITLEEVFRTMEKLSQGVNNIDHLKTVLKLCE